MEFFKEDQVGDIVHLLQHYCNPQTKNLELEFRLGRIQTKGRFEPSLNTRLYQNIISGLRTNPRWTKVIESHTIDYTTPKGLRITHDINDGSWSGLKKERVFTRTLESTPEASLDVRVSAALEIPYPTPQKPPVDFVLIREKRRTSFFHKFWRYDVTEVTVHTNHRPERDLDEDRKITYEVELELVDPNEIIGKPNDYIAYVVRFGLMLCCDMIRLAQYTL